MGKFYMTYFIYGLFPNWPFLMTGYISSRSDTSGPGCGSKSRLCYPRS